MRPGMLLTKLERVARDATWQLLICQHGHCRASIIQALTLVLPGQERDIGFVLGAAGEPKVLGEGACGQVSAPLLTQCDKQWWHGRHRLCRK